ncbi:MAG: T9SS type A sorting domain-containing protein, partial [Rhodothermales bacterium]|nr:T9SS type A sorting domain-containing protein [Rhodothermales bacterium]
SIDFRTVYATVLADWFGLGATDTAAVLGGEFGRIGFVADPATPTSVRPEEQPAKFTLRQNYPNPFNPTTMITYSLSEPSHVRLEVFDLQGRLVQRLADHQKGPGDYTMPFDAGNLPSGTYIYRLETNAGSVSRKMTFLR